MFRRRLATVWSLPNGTRCDLILVAGMVAMMDWELVVIRGAERLQVAPFPTIASAYDTARGWRALFDASAAQRTA